MDPTTIKTLSDLAGSLTTAGLLVLIIVALVRGIVITRSRFDDWVERCKREEARADALDETVRQMTAHFETQTRLLEALTVAIDKLRGPP